MRGEHVKDEDIVALYWARDESAVKETAEKYGGYCYQIALQILCDREDAVECVNDAYLNAWNSMPPHRPAILSTFLGKITRFAALKKRRGMQAAKRCGGEPALVYEELEECIPADGDIASALEGKELAAVIDRFLILLPTTERRVFVCRYWYFDSISSICEQFGFSESKVKSMLFRTRKKLLSSLKKEGVIIEK